MSITKLDFETNFWDLLFAYEDMPVEHSSFFMRNLGWMISFLHDLANNPPTSIYLHIPTPKMQENNGKPRKTYGTCRNLDVCRPTVIQNVSESLNRT